MYKIRDFLVLNVGSFYYTGIRMQWEIFNRDNLLQHSGAATKTCLPKYFWNVDSSIIYVAVNCLAGFRCVIGQ